MSVESKSSREKRRFTPLNRLRARRVRFFARREALFLWLLGGALVVFGIYWLGRVMFWTATQGSVLENFLRNIK